MGSRRQKTSQHTASPPDFEAPSVVPPALPLDVDSERRYAMRAPMVTAVSVLTADGARIAGQSSNVSDGGAALVVKGAFARGDVVTLRLALPGHDAEPFVLSAEVVWVRGTTELAAIGVAFRAVTPAQHAALGAYVVAFAPAEHE